MDKKEALDSIQLIRKVISYTNPEYYKGIKPCIFFFVYLAAKCLVNVAHGIYVSMGGNDHVVIRFFSAAYGWLSLIFVVAGLLAYVIFFRRKLLVERAFAEIWLILPMICVIIQRLQLYLLNIGIFNLKEGIGLTGYIFGYSQSAVQGNLMLIAFLMFTCIMASSIITNDRIQKRAAAVFLLLSLGAFLFKDINTSVYVYSFSFAYMYGLATAFMAWIIYRLKTINKTIEK